MTEICIIGAKRTVQGKFVGALAKKSAVDLAVAAANPAIGEVASDKIDQVIIGNVLAAGAGMNIARQVAIHAGLPLQVPAYTVNMMCGSGMQAVVLAVQAIRSGTAAIVLCGGTESMSNAPFLLDRARTGYKLGDGILVDSLLRDGLIDAFSQTHMGNTAEALAAKYSITREEQDRYAIQSHVRYFAALHGGEFADELVPIDGLTKDEHAREDVNGAKLATLKPAFTSDGTVTAANSSGMNDGAAMLLLCTQRTAEKNNWRPLATIGASVCVGCHPDWMGLGPVHAARVLCQQSSCDINSFDTIELNEAFAAQAIACMNELNLDPAGVNKRGGAIAIGHPIGASGARLVVHLAHQVARKKASQALGMLCIGGGMGIALSLHAAEGG